MHKPRNAKHPVSVLALLVGVELADHRRHDAIPQIEVFGLFEQPVHMRAVLGAHDHAARYGIELRRFGCGVLGIELDEDGARELYAFF